MRYDPPLVELLFEDAALAAVCGSHSRLLHAYGAAAARVIGARLHEIEAASTLGELRLLSHLRLAEVSGRPGCARVDVVPSLRLAMRQSGARRNRIEWHATDPVFIVEISDART